MTEPPIYGTMLTADTGSTYERSPRDIRPGSSYVVRMEGCLYWALK